MRHMSLQMRVALLSVVALIVCTVALTVVSVYSVEGIISSSEDYWGTQYGGDGLDALPQGQENADTVITLRKFNATSVILCVFVNLLGGIAIYLIMGRALRPLTKLIEAIERIDEQKLSEQIAETGANDEVGRLTHSFNGMMARLEDAFQRQSSFTANAAHELKTPLTIMKTGVQVLLADRAATLGDYQENGRELLDSIDRLAWKMPVNTENRRGVSASPAPGAMTAFMYAYWMMGRAFRKNISLIYSMRFTGSINHAPERLVALAWDYRL